MDDFEHYLKEIAAPTVADFRLNPTSRRHAFMACVALYHSADYLAHPANPAQIVSRFKSASTAYATIDRIAHAFKHVISDGPHPELHATAISPTRPARINQANVVQRPPATWGGAVWGSSRWDDPIGGVMLSHLPDIDVLEIAEEALRFLFAQVNLSQDSDEGSSAHE